MIPSEGRGCTGDIVLPLVVLAYGTKFRILVKVSARPLVPFATTSRPGVGKYVLLRGLDVFVVHVRAVDMVI